MRKPVLTRRTLGLAELTLVALAAAVFSTLGGPVLDREQEKSLDTQCCNNQKQLACAVMMYCQDNGEVLPPAATMWTDIRVDNGTLRCPRSPEPANGYVFNNRIGGLSLGDQNLGQVGDHEFDATEVFLTADGQHADADGATPNLAFTLADLDTVRHSLDEGQSSRFFASFLDGHVERTTGDTAKGWLLK